VSAANNIRILGEIIIEDALQDTEK